MTETLIYRIDQLYSYWLVTVLRKPIRVDIPVWKDSFRFGRPIAIQETSACDGDVESPRNQSSDVELDQRYPRAMCALTFLALAV